MDMPILTVKTEDFGEVTKAFANSQAIAEYLEKFAEVKRDIAQQEAERILNGKTSKLLSIAVNEEKKYEAYEFADNGGLEIEGEY